MNLSVLILYFKILHMRESFEKHHESDNYVRMAVMAALSSVFSASVVEAALPDCNSGSRPADPKSVRLKGGEEAKPICIVDGDTFDVKLKDGPVLRIRPWGYDCPETSMNDKCMRNGADECKFEIQRGKNAKEYTRGVLDGKKLVLEGPFSNNGNRKLAYVRVQGKDLGVTSILSCKCKFEEKYNHKRKKEYREAAKKCGQ
jgi:endonuclease YncB( thermonuclease family)